MTFAEAAVSSVNSYLAIPLLMEKSIVSFSRISAPAPSPWRFGLGGGELTRWDFASGKALPSLPVFGGSCDSSSDVPSCSYLKLGLGGVRQLYLPDHVMAVSMGGTQKALLIPYKEQTYKTVLTKTGSYNDWVDTKWVFRLVDAEIR